jgi:hypothetical protein
MSAIGELTLGQIKNVGHCGLISHVTPDRNGVTASARDRVDRLLSAVPITRVMHNDGEPLVAEALTDGATDAAGAASDDGHPFCVVLHVEPLCLYVYNLFICYRTLIWTNCLETDDYA